MSTSSTTNPPPGTFGAAVRHFSPAWFAAVMGTAVIPLALSFMPFGWVQPAAGVFLVLAVVMFVAILIPWLLRFLRHPADAAHDLGHPIAANFFPTMPISLIIIGLDLLKFPQLFFPAAVSERLALYLWLLGTAGIYLMGFLILIRIYSHEEIKVGHANFGWYIPPVSKLLIPVAGLELAQLFPAWASLAFVVSLVSLGVGFFLFLFVGAAVYHRYIYERLPVSRFAATFFIGIAPAAIIAVSLFKLMRLVEETGLLGLNADVVATLAKLGIVMTWGFALWWFVMGLIVVAVYLRRRDLPYALSWWAFTFPAGALAVASGVAWKVTNFGLIQTIYYAVVAFLLVVWGVVLARTVAAMASGKVFAPAH